MKKSKRRFIKSSNGITLIALVITIIVLLILAGISISMLSGDNSILQRATDSKEKTTAAGEKEQIQLEVLGSLENDGTLLVGTVNTNIKNHISGATTDDAPEFPLTVTYTATGNIYIIDENGNVRESVIADRSELNIGEYVDYSPDVLSTTVYEKTNLDLYSGNTSSSYNKTDMPQKTRNWKILRIYPDGSIDLVGDLSSSSYGTNGSLRLEGILGYKNGVHLLNDICKTLYSRNSDGIIARSININDYEYWLEQSPNGVSTRNEYVNYGSIKYNEEKTYGSGNNKYPALYKTQTSDSDEGVLTIDDSYVEDGDLTVIQTSYLIDVNANNFGDGADPLSDTITYFWVASRCVDADGDGECADFGLRQANSNILCGASAGFRSFGYNTSSTASIRPVVHLSSSVEITANEGTKNNPHEITKY